MITVVAISYTDVRDHPELLAEYAAECSIPTIGAINPQWEMYAALEATGVMQMLAVYVDGHMAGFVSILAAISPHYGVKLATSESLFIGKAWRWTRAGASLLRVAEQVAKDSGCKAFGRWRNGASAWKSL